MTALVLSLFPGIGLLDRAFEEEGFCVVRGPDLLWGGDIRRFHPPRRRFDGIIGGPPCQRFSGLGNVNIARWGDDSVMPNMIPDFERCIAEAEPDWFVMENVPGAPLPMPPTHPEYKVRSILLDNRWCGGEQRRRRRFSFGAHPHRNVDADSFHVPGVALEATNETPTVVSTGQADWKGSAQRNRASVEYMLEQQGMPRDSFAHSPFTITELRRAIANGVPLPMGREVARAVRRIIARRVAA
jgi:DNA (cytosine-5)-methyltransferase 1